MIRPGQVKVRLASGRLSAGVLVTGGALLVRLRGLLWGRQLRRPWGKGGWREKGLNGQVRHACDFLCCVPALPSASCPRAARGTGGGLEFGLELVALLLGRRVPVCALVPGGCMLPGASQQQDAAAVHR